MKIADTVAQIILLVVAVSLGAAARQQASADVRLAKSRLENLQRSLFALDENQHRETQKLEASIEEKGEFETTKQFEDRRSKIEKTVANLQFQIQMKDGPERDEIYKQINEILRAEFASDLDLVIGRYDADKARFSVFTKSGEMVGEIPVPVSEAPRFKIAFPQARATGKTGLLLDADNRAREYVTAAEVSLEGKTYPVLIGPFDQTRAMKLLFGNYGKVEDRSVAIWRRYDPWSEERKPAIMEAEPVLFKPFQEEGVEKYLLVAESLTWTPSVAIFKKSAGVWRLEMGLKDGGVIVRPAGAVEYHLVKLGPDKHALKIWHGNGRATLSEGETYWRIDGKFPRKILSLWTYQDNDEDWSIQDRISFRSVVKVLPKMNNGFFNIQVTSTGKKAKLVGKRWIMTPFIKTEIYVYSEGQYRETLVPAR